MRALLASGKQAGAFKTNRTKTPNSWHGLHAIALRPLREAFSFFESYILLRIVRHNTPYDTVL